MEYMPTILGVAEATHYLVGATDDEGSFVAFTELGEVAVCPSLQAAKLLLRDNNIYEAQLVLETAYDEMCGLASSGRVTETLYFK